MGAMPPEIEQLKNNVKDIEEIKINDFLTVFKGTYCEKTIVFASAGVGTVFAATTATIMVTMFNVDAMIFTGVAGGLMNDQKVGDIVIGTDTVNYDFDVTAFEPFSGCKFERGQLPFINWREYAADQTLLDLARDAKLPESFTGSKREGRIVTGSVFVIVPAKKELVENLEKCGLGQCEAVEMECAGVAQVCKSFNKPFLGLRALSDVMEGDANADFNAFTQ
jgi:adenosylhomocysteine nucleosidase